MVWFQPASKSTEVYGTPYVKPAKLVVPPEVVKLTEPVAPFRNTAVTVLLSTMVKLYAAVPPNETAEVELKFVPLIVTVVPAFARIGVK